MVKFISYLLAAFFCSNGFTQSPAPAVHVNQLGFYTNAPKQAAILNAPNDSLFSLVDAVTKAPVWKGKLDKAQAFWSPLLQIKTADFSTWTKPGHYFIRTNTGIQSYPFIIAANVYDSIAKAALKAYYYQRASMPLDEKFAGKWKRKEGHPDSIVLVHASAATAQIPEGSIISCAMGWYDAGDYNKYIVNSGITMGTLLSAYEDYSSYYAKLNTNIPESNDAIPDILNEVLYSLRWMLTMQDKNDGGVYHKCTTAEFEAMVMPDKATHTRYVVEKGTAATLDFAAVMAHGARVFNAYEKQLPGLSDSCVKAATYAWNWAVANPGKIYDQDANNKNFSPAIHTGGYGDKKLQDEWFWAASELYVLTRSASYKTIIDQHIETAYSIPSWGNVHMLGIYSLLHSKALDESVHTTLKNRLYAFADSLVNNQQQNALHTVMGSGIRDFGWGSNATAANQSVLLIQAYNLSDQPKYLAAAISNLDYILGKNATGYCFVTGLGSYATRHPHHRISVADGIDDPVPGLLAGGPNPAMQDKCKYLFTAAPLAYTDDDCSYASNEIAINWNAPLVYLSGTMQALQFRVQWSTKEE